MPGSARSAASIASNNTDGSRSFKTSGSGRHHHRIITATGSHNSQHSSRRSPSPSDHYRKVQGYADRLQDRLFELNKFIYQGVEKFLDRQAVRDLIAAYDANDIITAEDGLESSFFSFSLALKGDGFSQNDDDDEDHLLTIVQEQGKTFFVKQNFTL